MLNIILVYTPTLNVLEHWQEEKMEDDVTEETKNETTEIELQQAYLRRSEKKFVVKRLKF
jgi:hypothetical protein